MRDDIYRFGQPSTTGQSTSHPHVIELPPRKEQPGTTRQRTSPSNDSHMEDGYEMQDDIYRFGQPSTTCQSTSHPHDSHMEDGYEMQDDIYRFGQPSTTGQSTSHPHGRELPPRTERPATTRQRTSPSNVIELSLRNKKPVPTRRRTSPSNVIELSPRNKKPVTTRQRTSPSNELQTRNVQPGTTQQRKSPSNGHQWQPSLRPMHGERVSVDDEDDDNCEKYEDLEHSVQHSEVYDEDVRLTKENLQQLVESLAQKWNHVEAVRLTNEDLLQLVESLAQKWDLVGISLGIATDALTNIDKDNGNNDIIMSFQMLETWLTRCNSNTNTFEILREALENANCLPALKYLPSGKK
ncbi:uncharacterized protein LOC115232413 isoform X2 [Octopus sinensis]|uniref:Uncharacterized protein LOC115232413 isoform X2 n=1 Tax=Octopus sinensis TaxID=2607531 RepID=A0A7E6FPU3_9MOLL|nr:uncharacterized protein LOC115232413 isoform X2 [Octopus sinensis]